MLLIFDSDNDRWLDNHLADGTTIHLGMRFFKAFEKITPEAAAELNVLELVDIVAAGDA